MRATAPVYGFFYVHRIIFKPQEAELRGEPIGSGVDELDLSITITHSASTPCSETSPPN